MFIKDDKWDDLADDVSKLDYVKGNFETKYKYKVTIPAAIWNKWRPDKIEDHRTIKFGRVGYQQYFDKLRGWSKYDHSDIKRRINYQKRHRAIMIKLGEKKYPSYQIPFTAEFFSYYLLW